MANTPVRSVRWQAIGMLSQTIADLNVQTITYGLTGQLEKVITETRNSSNALLTRSRVDYRYDTMAVKIECGFSCDLDNVLHFQTDFKEPLRSVEILL